MIDRVGVGIRPCDVLVCTFVRAPLQGGTFGGSSTTGATAAGVYGQRAIFPPSWSEWRPQARAGSCLFCIGPSMR